MAFDFLHTSFDFLQKPHKHWSFRRLQKIERRNRKDSWMNVIGE